MRFFQPFIGYFKGLPILLTFLLIFGYGDPAEAANASHKNKAEELLKLVKIENQLGQIGNQVMMPIKQRLSMVRTNETRAKLIREHITSVQQLVNQQLSWDSTREAYIDIYADTYSETELDELIEFFSSATGQKFVSQKPEFNQKVANLTTSRIEALKPKMEQLDSQFKAKLAELAEVEKEVTQ